MAVLKSTHKALISARPRIERRVGEMAFHMVLHEWEKYGDEKWNAHPGEYPEEFCKKLRRVHKDAKKIDSPGVGDRWIVYDVLFDYGGTRNETFQHFLYWEKDLKVRNDRTMECDRTDGEPFDLIATIRGFLAGNKRVVRFKTMEPDIRLEFRRFTRGIMEFTCWAEWDTLIYGDNQLGIRFNTSAAHLAVFADELEDELEALVKQALLLDT